MVEFPKTAAELFDYDVIVAFDPDWSRIPVDWRKFLMDWVSEHGGGLILVAGDIYTPQLAATTDDALKDLQKLYPVVLSASISELSLDAKSEQPWPVALMPEGVNAGFLQLADNSPDIKCNGTSSRASTAAIQPRGRKRRRRFMQISAIPACKTSRASPFCLQRSSTAPAGSFTSAALKCGGWRGRRSVFRAILDQDDPRSRAGEASARHGPRLVALERSQYALGQMVRIRANLLDPQLNPLEVDSVELNVFDPHGTPLATPRTLRRDPDKKAGQYWAEFRAAMPGTYRVLVRPQPDDDKQNLNARIDVVLPNLESDNPRQNAKLLTDLARETGGKYLSIENAAAELPALLPDRGERFAVDEQLRPLWDQEWVLYLLVGLLGFEWVIRKLLRLA